MNADLLTDDLKKKWVSNEGLWLIGQPDVRVECITNGEGASKFRISLQGFDCYNTKINNADSGAANRNRSVDARPRLRYPSYG